MSISFFCMLLLVSAQVDPAAPDEGLESGALAPQDEIRDDRNPALQDPDEIDEVEVDEGPRNSKNNRDDAYAGSEKDSDDGDESQRQEKNQNARVKKYKNADFVEMYFPFSTNRNLHSSVDTTWHFIGGCCGFIGGQVWLPMLFGARSPAGLFT
ncbi:MAG: hypothetical protein GY822_32735 [Deltaproteobacteria bacterium]|nr:hypothetical protein [Deltaproteobacteria bacterium]